jgi:predicted small secreted protein
MAVDPTPAGYVATPAPTSVPSAPTSTAPGLLDDLDALYPWLKQIGLPAAWFQTVAASSASDAEVVAKLRMTSQYKSRFPAIIREDGSMVMTEAQYLSQEDDYRKVLRQGGVSAANMDNPADFIGWFQSGVDPNELQKRVDIYNNVRTNGQDQMDAFYVYAGMRVGIDDLYAAVVDPAASQRLTEEFNQKVASQPFDYMTWITRATEAGLSRVASSLSGLQANGVLTGAAVQSIIGTDPSFARSVMDALYHGGDPTTGKTLNLTELMHSFEYAALGAAATGAGLSLPPKDQIAQIRAAGIDRAAAQKAYTDYGQNKNLYAGAVARSGGGTFTQSDFESAAFLGKIGDVNRLSKALGQEQSLGEQQGQFGLGQNKRGRYTQAGLVG